jgi:hypothetical protein
MNFCDYKNSRYLECSPPSTICTRRTLFIPSTGPSVDNFRCVLRSKKLFPLAKADPHGREELSCHTSSRQKPEIELFSSPRCLLRYGSSMLPIKTSQCMSVAIVNGKNTHFLIYEITLPLVILLTALTEWSGNRCARGEKLWKVF